MESLKLSNGISIPAIGMGTFPLQGVQMQNAVKAALVNGYRAFDTAYGYNNDIYLGDALKLALSELNLNREDVFITSKIGDELIDGRPTGCYFYDAPSCINRDVRKVVESQIESVLNNLHTDYLDMLLIHYPYPHIHTEIWSYLEEAYNKGVVKAIGVSNYRERHLDELISQCTIRPMLNQYEHHPLNTKKEVLQYCKREDIIVQAYSPLLVMNPKLTNNSMLIRIASSHKKSIPQIILRWNIQLGIIPIPKSSNKLRLKENISIFDFELSSEEMFMIDNMNINFKALPESLYCPGY